MKGLRTSVSPSRVSILSLFPQHRKMPFLAAANDRREQFIGELRNAYTYEGLALYIGAGVSRSVGLPSWPELIRYLTVQLMVGKAHSAITDINKFDLYWEAISEFRETIQKKADTGKPILLLARAIKGEFGETLQRRVSSILYRPIQRRIDMKRRSSVRGIRGPLVRSTKLPTSPLIDAIVALARAERDVRGVQAIVNYNYDDLLEEKLREENVNCKTVLSGKERIPLRSLPSYHVHGVLPLATYIKNGGVYTKEKIGNFVFSEDEYHAEYSDAYRWSNLTQISSLGRHIGLFVGLSLEDPNIRRLIDVTHRQYPEIANYAILTRSRSLKKSGDSKDCLLQNLFEDQENKSFEGIGVRVIWVDSYDEIPSVLHSICSEDLLNKASGGHAKIRKE